MWHKFLGDKQYDIVFSAETGFQVSQDDNKSLSLRASTARDCQRLSLILPELTFTFIYSMVFDRMDPGNQSGLQESSICRRKGCAEGA